MRCANIKNNQLQTKILHTRVLFVSLILLWGLWKQHYSPYNCNQMLHISVIRKNNEYSSISKQNPKKNDQFYHYIHISNLLCWSSQWKRKKTRFETSVNWWIEAKIWLEKLVRLRIFVCASVYVCESVCSFGCALCIVHDRVTCWFRTNTVLFYFSANGRSTVNRSVGTKKK